MTGHIVLLDAPATLITSRDYTAYNAYLDEQGLFIYEGEGAQNFVRPKELNVPETDTRANPNEMPSALGKMFAQGDFSHGSGQAFFHKQSSDQAKFNYSEGFDTSEPGILRHLNEMLLNVDGALTAGSSGRSAQAQGKKFVADGNNVRVYNLMTGASTVRNPHVLETPGPVYDLTAEGDRVFAALGANGIHVSSDGGTTWTHYSDAQAILVDFLKDRLIAATARIIYEITGSGSATGMDMLTLKEGWAFTDLGENGPFIYAPCHDDESLSKVHIFGINSSLDLGPIGSNWLPENDLCTSFTAQLGMALLGCGRVNEMGGRDAVLYKAIPDADGFLPIELVSDSEGAGELDLSVKAIGTHGRDFLVGWSLGDDAPFGKREGMAIYDPALDSFSNHHFYDISSDDPDPLLSVSSFQGIHTWVTAKGVFYEDMETLVAEAYVIPSTGNWNNPGLKNWDQSELGTKALPPTSSVEFQYTTGDPLDGEWSIAGLHDTPGDKRSTFRHPNTESATFTPKLISYATESQAEAPEIQTFSVRSNPTVESTAYRIVATVRLFNIDQFGDNGAEAIQVPRDIREFLEEKYLTWFDYYTADVPDGFNCRLVDYQITKPAEPVFETVPGEKDKEGFLMTLVMDGERN
jgi:hypothetical protein